jgi:thioredoxin 1
MPSEPSREEVDRLPGPVLLEFGASWCPHCRTIAPVLTQLLEQYPQVRHVKIEDGPGQPLGRSFHVKVWPSLFFQQDGQVIRKLVRPSEEAIRQAMAELISCRSRDR